MRLSAINWGTAGDPTVAHAAAVAAAGYMQRTIGGEDERTVWGQVDEDGNFQVFHQDPEGGGDELRDFVMGIGIYDIEIGGVSYKRIGDPENPQNLAYQNQYLPLVKERAFFDPVYGWLLDNETVKGIQYGSYTGGGTFYLDPVLHLIAPNVYQPHIEQEKLAGNAPIILAAIITAGAASGAFSGFAVAEAGALTVEGAALVAEGSTIVAEGVTVAEGGFLTSEGATLIGEGVTIAGESVGAEIAAEELFAGELAESVVEPHLFADAMESQLIESEILAEIPQSELIGELPDVADTEFYSPYDAPFQAPSVPGTDWVSAAKKALQAGASYLLKKDAPKTPPRIMLAPGSQPGSGLLTDPMGITLIGAAALIAVLLVTKRKQRHEPRAK